MAVNYLGEKINSVEILEQLVYKLDCYFYVGEQDAEKKELSCGTNLIEQAFLWDLVCSYKLNRPYINIYTGAAGDMLLRRTIKLYESVTFGNAFFNDREVYVTAGAGEALDITFGYLHSINKQNVLVIGAQYPIVGRTISQNGMYFQEMIGESDNNFMPEIAAVEKAIYEGGFDCIFLTQPNNPSGGMYSKEELRRLVKAAQEYHMVIIYEKVGSDFLMDENAGGIDCFNDMASDELIVIDSLSKRRALSGLKIGYVISDKSKFARTLEQMKFGSCAPCVGNKGVIVDLYFSFLLYHEMHNKQYEKTELCYEIENEIEKLGCLQHMFQQFKEEIAHMQKSILENQLILSQKCQKFIVGQTHRDGGFNYLVNFKLREGLSDYKLARRIYRKCGVRVYPLACFLIDQNLNQKFWEEGNCWIRVSLAVETEEMVKCCDLISQYYECM